MIFFYGEGRIGNQIFQYQLLSRISKPGERIIAVGLEDLEQYLELRGPRILVLTRNRNCKRIFKYLLIPLVLRFLSRTLRLCNYGFESVCGPTGAQGADGELSLWGGLLRVATFIDGGYYQNSAYWSTLFPAADFTVRAGLRDAARRFLAPIRASGSSPVFVHVRRTDYLTHTDYGLRDLTLPAEYYLAAMEQIKRKIQSIHFVFVTDDPQWVEQRFGRLSEKTIASFDPKFDFAIMTQCVAGIVSNSTFALSAAFSLDSPPLVLAPKFWLGFRVDSWFPPRIQFAHPALEYISVPVAAGWLAADRIRVIQNR